MKRILLVSMMLGLFVAAPGLANDKSDWRTEPVHQCQMEAIDLAERIANIQKAIATQKYSPEELKAIKAKLEKANAMMKDVQKGGN